MHLEDLHQDLAVGHEHLKGLLYNTDTFELLLSPCNSLSQARIPQDIAEALMGARLTALTKLDGGVRGIATGCSLRRLVARKLAKQFCEVFEAECTPFQCALSTRAVTDCVGHMLRAATDANPTATIQSVDGNGDVRTMFTGQRCWPGWFGCRAAKGIAAICADVLRSAFQLHVLR